ncbi:N-acetylmuramoyl-L-alanine amidase [Paenibacillus xylaniclasticus]|uniref:N-acetylmuramoyl-L-alanine amidase n=1 Tax=Paenibacillus xylaniclasticus TaxID=588083 RepID=UPI001763028B|nr:MULTISPECIES: S-layer homology domain-containing protein [Paenibacillus]GFN30807.1 hypothetical protein PCURB6_10670 [Paenibacillus curdlanolyticus]
MKQEGQFILFSREEFNQWIEKQNIKRSIKILQVHHTWKPSYDNFKGNNHFTMLKGMRNSHINNNGWSDIGQNLTIFPDGVISLCRPLEVSPAGIKGANVNGICVEIIGNFDIGGDRMTEEQKKSTLYLFAVLAKKFNLNINTDTIVYHHWYCTKNGVRIPDNKINTNNTTGYYPKSCPGSAFFGGNKVVDAQKSFIPLVQEEYNKLLKKEIVETVMTTFSRYFNDVTKQWQASTIDAAVDKGIFAVGTDKKFRPDEPITRAEIAIVAERVINYVLNKVNK